LGFSLKGSELSWERSSNGWFCDFWFGMFIFMFLYDVGNGFILKACIVIFWRVIVVVAFYPLFVCRWRWASQGGSRTCWAGRWYGKTSQSFPFFFLL